jgi:4-amino-4-deoxy-L-arabinose transferase-like glycosyltransferase
MIALLITLAAFVFMYPWARFFMRENSRIALALTTMGLSLGTLSLVMLWLGLLNERINWRITMGVCALIGLVGLALWPFSGILPLRRRVIRYPLSRVEMFLMAIISLSAALILFNAVYWPFGIDDAVTIYAWYGKQISLTEMLPRGSLYETYPMMIPLLYAFTHEAAGAINDHLAALIPAALSVGVIGVAFLLGRELYDRFTGIVAALLIAITPMFTHWASSGYVDLPAGFFYGLSAYFLVRAGDWSETLLAGFMAGLSAWTKNSGLLIVISMALWLVYLRWRKKRLPPRPGLLILGSLLAAGPWYMRNWITAGILVPPTAWTWKAAHTLVNLFPYIADPRYFVIGWLFTAGILFTSWRLGQGNSPEPKAAFLLIFFLPFFTIWWLLFSYDGRFLLILTPFAAVMTASMLQSLIPFINTHYARYLPVALAVLILLLALPAYSAAVDYKPELLRQPFMSDDDKYRLRFGADRYDIARYLSNLPPGSKIWTEDLLIPYHADGVQMTVGDMPTEDLLNGYDYWLLSPGDALPDWFGPDVPVHREGEYRLYAVSVF